MIIVLVLILFILRIRGKSPIFIAAPPTAFTQDGEVNLSVIIHQAEMLTDNQVDGVFVTGTTGESLSLTISERKAILDAWISTKKSTKYALKIIMHVGHNSLEDSADLSIYAEKAGADAIGAMPPTFFRPSTPGDLAKSMASFANLVNLPFYYYHIPSMTGVNINMIDFLPFAVSEIKNFKGIKFTDYNLYDFGLCVNYMNTVTVGKDLEMLFGHDETMLAAYLFGASGFVGSTYNFAGGFYRQILDAYHKGNVTYAWELQSKSQLMVQAMLAPEGATPGTKAIMQLKGVEIGPCRLPLNTVSESQKHELAEELKKIGFL